MFSFLTSKNGLARNEAEDPFLFLFFKPSFALVFLTILPQHVAVHKKHETAVTWDTTYLKKQSISR